jgi:hypothetical protein
LSDACGQSRALTVLTPVKDEGSLRAALGRIPDEERSPLARLPGTHFGRWVVMPDLGDGPQLLFSATHDKSDDDYLQQIAAHMADEADEIWGQCEGYPGAADRGAFVDYLKRHRVRTNLFVSAYPRATLDEVLEGLDLRRRLGDFAPRAQSMDPEQLRAEFGKAGLA